MLEGSNQIILKWLCQIKSYKLLYIIYLKKNSLKGLEDLGSEFDEIVIDVEQRQIKMDASLKLGYYLPNFFNLSLLCLKVF